MHCCNLKVKRDVQSTSQVVAFGGATFLYTFIKIAVMLKMQSKTIEKRSTDKENRFF